MGVVLALALVAPGPAQATETAAEIPTALLSAADAYPTRPFRVIVVGDGIAPSKVATHVRAAEETTGGGTVVRAKLRSVSGVLANVSGDALLALAQDPQIKTITRDTLVRVDASNIQDWPTISGVAANWPTDASSVRPATIAVVDSGVDQYAGLGRRLLANVDLARSRPNSRGDGFGHGTFVASIAAGSAAGHAGAAPNAKVVSIDVANDYGMAWTSDVIEACDWILRHRNTFDIRVANFSLHSARPSNFTDDPLDKAVERLWFAGVVVVASSGNYGTPDGPSGVVYAPANDPFVITVGALDTNGTLDRADDFAAPWSAWGYTYDGFAKPELSAPGRNLIGAVPPLSTMAVLHPERLVATGYMRMSGTSFAAAIVSGAAAQVLGAHPAWTPDEVKGALMLSAYGSPNFPRALGVGELDAAGAVALASAPNPNLALDQFLVYPSVSGSLPVFDAASWANAAAADASWANASWADASWASASWVSASWASASWSSASWADASWASASWADASWADLWLG